VGRFDLLVMWLKFVQPTSFGTKFPEPGRSHTEELTRFALADYSGLSGSVFSQQTKF